MKKLLLAGIILLILILATRRLAEGQTATPSPTLSVNPQVKEKIKQRLDQAVASPEQVKGLITTQSQKLQKKAYAGPLTKIEKQTLFIQTHTGVKEASTSAETVFVRSPGRQEISLDDLEPDQFIIAMGFADPDGLLDARRVVVVTNPTQAPKRTLFAGKIKEIDGSKVSFDDQTITIGRKVKLVIKGVEKPSIDKLQLDDQIFVIAVVDDEGEIQTVKKVLVIPGRNNPEAEAPINGEEEATPSATPTPSH